MTAFETLRPPLSRHAWAYDASCIVAASLFVGISAQLAIRLPFSPVPITAQTLAALMVGALLGRHRGSLALLVYIAEGALGLPVFAGGGFGLARLFGPTGGYLIGLVAAAYVTGMLAERGWDRRVPATMFAMAIGNSVVYVIGLICLAKFVGTANALPMGLYPFIPGDILKIVVAAVLLPVGWRVLRKPQ